MEDKEWKVMLNGKLYTDRFDSRGAAIEYINECANKGVGDVEEFTVEIMLHEEINQYYHNKL